MLDLAHSGQLDAIFLNVRRGGTRTECWIRRESLNRWMTARDAEVARYMPRSEAIRELGLTMATVVRVAAAGALRYVEGPERNFPAGCFFFLREDVMKIKEAFEEHTVPVKEYSNPGELIALRHAMKNYLGHGADLAAVIQAVVDRRLVPTGRTERFRGITGYLFRSEDLRNYRPAPGIMAPPGGFLSFKEAAALLGVRTNVIRGLTDQGVLTASSDFRNGFARLLPAKEVQQFAACYVATSVLVKRFEVNSGSLARYLRASGTPLLAVLIPDAGKGHAFFLQRNAAARIELPSREMVREASAMASRPPGRNKGQSTGKPRKSPWGDLRDEFVRLVGPGSDAM